jgi:hypothetical protein
VVLPARRGAGHHSHAVRLSRRPAFIVLQAAGLLLIFHFPVLALWQTLA